MEQKDYLLREIEKIRIVLEAMLKKIKGGDSDIGPLNENFDQVNKLFITDTRVNLNTLLESGNNQFDNIFKKENGYDETNIEQFADILTEMANKAEGNLKDQLNQKALETYEYVDTLSNSFSFGRKMKMDALKKELE